ncbi:Rhodocoxin reductase [Paraconexibacter sp. AEG42_29]|uniref:Rhodocoxin reductase n=2 Tax=Paraconexibacter sp. AEG42_29 TaxID=2997339 RepID=A0AAU7ATP1_9ACTN
MACARAYRDVGAAGSVVMVADEGRMPYRRPPLTKEYLRGAVTADALPLEESGWPAANGVGFVAGRATALDPSARRIGLANGRELSYANCLLAPGARPVRLPIDGADDPGVLVIRTLEHARDLVDRLQPGHRVIVMGSGFVGCEVAASLSRRGHPVHLISDEPLPQARRLGDDVGRRLRDWLEADDVTLALGAAVERVTRAAGELAVHTAAGSARADLIVMAAGAAPRTELARSAGLPLHGGAVPADAGMRTAAPGVLAAGDVCRAQHAIAGRSLHVEHWGSAIAQGDVAGRTAAGAEAEWDVVPGFWSTIGERTLKYAAWGDGHDDVAQTYGADGAFTVRYRAGGRLVGVLTHGHDEDYAAGRDEIAAGAA